MSDFDRLMKGVKIKKHSWDADTVEDVTSEVVTTDNTAITLVNTGNSETFRVDHLGRKQGHYQKMNKDGTIIIKSGNYKDDLRDGVWYIYHTSKGYLTTETHFVKGVLNGRQTMYRESGQFLFDSMMKDGKHHGEFRRYNESGYFCTRIYLNDRILPSDYIKTKFGIDVDNMTDSCKKTLKKEYDIDFIED